MTMNHPLPGANNAVEYMISGIPYVASGTATAGTVSQLTFPYVTRDVYVRSRGTGLAVGFSYSGTLGTARFTLNTDEFVTLDVRTKEIFFTSTTGSVFYEVVAGQTRIPYSNFPVLTAANGFTGIG